MVNQWGRDSEFRSVRRGISPALVIIAVILALLLGVAGGYGVFRFTQPQASIVADDAQVEELKARLASQARELDAMAEKLDQSSSEIAATQVLSVVVETLTAERDMLAAESTSLKAELAALEADRDTAGENASAERARMAAELERLQNEVVPDLTAERDRLKREARQLLSETGVLKARAQVAADRRVYDDRRIAELEAQLAEAEQQLLASQEQLDALSLEGQDSEAPAAVADTTESNQPEKPDTDDNPSHSPRTAEGVANALSGTPGLENLSGAERQQLTEALVAGECVTTALKSVFERVPILTLRNLIRDLNSDC